MSSPHQPVYRFGPFEADVESGEIRKHDIRLRIQALPFRLLVLLIEHRNRIVTRQELHQILWPGRPEGEFDDSLNAVVKKLRDALADDAGRPLYIETVPRRGYRFIAPVEAVPAAPADTVPDDAFAPPNAVAVTSEEGAVERGDSNPDADHLPLRWSPSRLAIAVVSVLLLCLLGLWTYRTESANDKPTDQPIRSIAVLPFENLSGDPNQDYFVDGLTEAVITDLAQIGSIRVTSETSAMEYRAARKPFGQIRRELSVDAIVVGSVARTAGKVRVNARLIGPTDSQYLWAQSFERDAGDIVSLQDEVALSVADRIQASIKPDELARLEHARPASVEAYEAYLQGLFYLNHRTDDDLRRSLDYFTRATSLDPNLAVAYAGKAEACGLLADYDVIPDREAWPKARAAALQAIRLDDSLGLAHSALAFELWKYEWDWTGAKAEFHRALALSPNDANTHHLYAVLLASQGNFEAAKKEIQIARQLDPLSLIVRTNVGWLSYYQRDFPTAIEEYEATLRLDPVFVPAHQKLWIAYAIQGHKQKAAGELENVFRVFGHDDMAKRVEGTDPAHRYELAVTSYADSGYLSAYEHARVLSLLGRKEEALQALSQAEAQHSSWLTYLAVEPAFDPIRSTPRFQQLVAEVGARSSADPSPELGMTARDARLPK